MKPEQNMRNHRRGRAAFTLVELLVVIAIIGILARIALPAFKGLGQGNTAVAANRQLKDDVGLARATAINERTRVYIVFIPELSNTAIAKQISAINQNAAGLPVEAVNRLRRQFTNALAGQYTSYALFTRRRVGAQPGADDPHYLTEWRSLPQGELFHPDEFKLLQPNTPVSDLPFEYNDDTSPNPERFPFPSDGAPEMALPYIAFSPTGQLEPRRVNPNTSVKQNVDEYINLAHGSIFFGRDQAGNVTGGADVSLSPKGNTSATIHVSWLTGRTHLEQPDDF